MSVLVVSSESLSKLYRGLTEAWWNRNRFPCFNPIRTIIGKNPADENEVYKDVEEFVDKCAKWNVAVYRQRYGQHDEEARNAEAVQYSHHYNGKVTLGQVFKTLSCLLYNSYLNEYAKDLDEETVKEWKAWYSTLERLYNMTAYAIVESTDDYRKAVWG